MCIIVLLYNVHLQVLQRHDPATWSGLHGRQYLVHDLRLCHGILSSHLAGQLNYRTLQSSVFTPHSRRHHQYRQYQKFIKCLQTSLLRKFLQHQICWRSQNR